MDQDDNGCPQGALPLNDAMRQWLPVEVLGAVWDAQEDLRKNARHVSWRAADGTLRSRIDETSPFNVPFIQRSLAAKDAAEAQFRAMLRAGRLVAWGRAGSPIAPHRRIPADAWASLRLAHVAEGRAHGPGVELFGLHVAPAAAPVEPAPAAPLPPEPASSPPANAPSALIESAAEAWMRANVTHAGRWKRDAAIKACSAEAPATYRDSRSAWNSLDHDLKRGRGRPPAAE